MTRKEFMSFEWLFGNKKDTLIGSAPINEEHPCLCDDDAPVVFEGTTEELLCATQAICDPLTVEEPPKEEESMEEVKPSNDQVWTNIEFLKMALEIEASKSQKNIFYIDIGQLPKAKAEEYVKALMTKCTDKDGDFWLPRKEGGRGTELTVAPGRVTLEDVLATAEKLKEFATS